MDKIYWIESDWEGYNCGDCLILDGGFAMFRKDEGENKTPYSLERLDDQKFADYMFFLTYEELAAHIEGSKPTEPDWVPTTDDRGILLCKGCGNENLHKIKGRELAYSCEHCDHITQLKIEGHKGNIFVETI
jgi:hypothetical protein